MRRVDAVPVVAMRRVRQSDLATSYVLELDIKDQQDMKYKTLDNLGVFPENDPQTVTDLAAQQGWELDKSFVLKSGTGPDPRSKMPFPTPLTVRDALTRFCDIAAIPTYFVK